SKGKLPLPAPPMVEAIELEGFRILPVRPEHVDAVRSLPRGLDDPFDRLLLATAMSEGLTLLTRDRAILKFAGQVSASSVRQG
ncbi:MAG: type II toxin-antitoxin system VapC family toxin, partial [Betaproteobacteria bacterium]